MTPSSPDAERLSAIALSLLPGVGAVTFRQLVSRYGSAERALAARGTEAQSAREAATAAIDGSRRVGARVVAQAEHDFPPPLLELPDPPPYLFAAGDLEALRAPCVAIVGTRDSTAYGERVTAELAAALARAGATVVSGMARGIDAAAHKAALAAGGRTAAVLGTGIDVAYPVAHRALHRDIAERGLLLSEELPGTRATAGSFPKRNRVIAALASVTIVVEAGARSGALITAGHALDLGRTVAAVPGPIDSPQSAGSNELLRDGAVVIATVADAVALAGLTAPVRRDPELATSAETAVWIALGAGAADIDALALRSALPARECIAAVTSLELRGAIECALTGEIRRR